MNEIDGHYGIDCYYKASPGDGEPDRMIFTDRDDELNALVLQANSLIAERQFELIELCEKRSGYKDGWYRITRFTQPDQVE